MPKVTFCIKIGTDFDPDYIRDLVKTKVNIEDTRELELERLEYGIAVLVLSVNEPEQLTSVKNAANKWFCEDKAPYPPGSLLLWNTDEDI